MERTKKNGWKQYCWFWNRSVVAPLLHRYFSAVAPLLLLLLSLRSHSCYRIRCRSAVAPMSLRCRSAIAQLSLHCCSAAGSVAPFPLLSLLLSLRFHFCYLSCCRYTVTPSFALLSLWCRSGVALVSLGYCSVISPPSLGCCSATAAVTDAIAPAIAPAVTPLLLLGFLTVIASRGRIRVTVSIGECQARVSSSSEGCSTLLKTVKVEAY